MTDTRDLQLLGLKVRDKVTGFVGHVSSISYDLYGCIQAVVMPPVNDKGELADGRWFDVSRLDVLADEPVMEIPGGRFSVQRPKSRVKPSLVAGPSEKPHR